MTDSGNESATHNAQAFAEEADDLELISAIRAKSRNISHLERQISSLEERVEELESERRVLMREKAGRESGRRE